MEMSVIVLSPDRYSTVERTLNHLREQTIREKLEILMVVPSIEFFACDGKIHSEFGAFRMIEIGMMGSEAEARAVGVREADAPIVVFTEDHCFPEPQWAEFLLQAHRQQWAAVGPAVKNANPWSLVSWTNFIIEYSHWAYPTSGGSMEHLPGHNCSYKRDILLLYGERLGKWLEMESTLHYDLQERGYSLYLENRAVINHLNYSCLRPSIVMRFVAGRLFAGARKRKWPHLKRILYVLGSPLIPWVRLVRIMKVLQHHKHVHPIQKVLPLLIFLLVVDAAGEMTGYLLGEGNAICTITQMDFHRERYMTPLDRKKSFH